jgi:hypothetical protein
LLAGIKMLVTHFFMEQGGASVTPTSTGTIYAKWTQNSLVGINPAHLNSLVELTMVSNSASLWTGSHTLSGTAAELEHSC